MSTRLLLIFALMLAAPGAPRAEDAEPKTPDQKALYAIGTGMARDLLALKVTPEELRFLVSGIQDHYAKKSSIDLGDQQTSENIQRFQRERFQAAMQEEESASQKFLEAAAKEKGAKKLSSGLVYLELKPGTGKNPQNSDVVRVTYKGTLRDKSVFDSALDPKEPAEFQLGAVIPCWQQALSEMKPGGKARFVCPSEMAYGNRGMAPAIRPGAALQFEVELLEIVPPAAPVAPSTDGLKIPGGDKPKTGK
jgi:FKBP-type peptidyl-prolyl cis-trans isomerase FkpA